MREAADGLLIGRVSPRSAVSGHFTPPFYSFSFETTKDTAGCRAFHRNYIVGGQRFDPAYLHQTNHKVKALWFELFKEKLRNRIPRKGAGSASSKALPAPFFVFCLAYDQPESQLPMGGIHIDGAQVPNTEQRSDEERERPLFTLVVMLALSLNHWWCW